MVHYGGLTHFHVRKGDIADIQCGPTDQPTYGTISTLIGFDTNSHPGNFTAYAKLMVMPANPGGMGPRVSKVADPVPSTHKVPMKFWKIGEFAK